MNITVEIKAPELASAIQALAVALSGSGLKTFSPVVTVDGKPAVTEEGIKDDKVAVSKEAKEKAKAAEKEVEKAPEKKEEPVKAEEPPTEDKPTIDLEVVRAKLAALSQKGKQKEVKALISEFGVKKLTDVPADKYEELLTKAEAL